MSLSEFLDSPSKTNHRIYKTSLFSPAAAEYSTGEVLLGATYRRLILRGVSEPDIDLQKIQGLPNRFGTSTGGEMLWNSILNQGGLGSPPTQRSKYPQLMPLVPEIARYASVLGSQRQRWNPSNLLLEVIGAGFGKDDGEALIQKFGKALEVNQDDDLFARFIEASFLGLESSNLPDRPYMSQRLTDEYTAAYRGKSTEGSTPAERFCRDLEVIIDQKGRLTRRQWTVLVEATLRLGLGMHLLWISQANSMLWMLLQDACKGVLTPSEAEIEKLIWNDHRENKPLLQVGSPAMPLVEQLIREYLAARLGINLVLYQLEEKGVAWNTNISYSSIGKQTPASQIYLFLNHVHQFRNALSDNPYSWLMENCARSLDKIPELVKLDSGFTKNMREFVRHSLGQLDTRSKEQSAYDQAYLMRNKNSSKKELSLSIIVMPGPAMLIAMVNACYHAKGMKLASLEDLRLHLSDYGLHVPAGELTGGQVGYDLQKLGLVVDSPDAAGGRLLVPPFNI